MKRRDSIVTLMPRGEVVVVLTNSSSWDFPCDHILQTTLELKKRCRVLTFSPLEFFTLRQVIFEKKIVCPSKREEIQCFPSFGIIPFQRFKIIKKLNIFLNLSIFRLFYRLKFGCQQPIFWVFSEDFAKVISFFKWKKLLVYDRVDQVVSLDPIENKARRQKDRLLLRMSDFVFTNSSYALKYIKRYNKRSFLVPCGCVVDFFLRKKIAFPREIKKIKKPIIGLIGSIDHRLDFEILYSLEKKRKKWNFVFVGSPFNWEPKQFKIVGLSKWLNTLKKLPNVYFLGQKPKAQMPDFIAGFDVCLIPYNISYEFVKGCNPMKLYEFLIMGKPVVSTPIETVKKYVPIVKIANDAIGFEKAIESFLKKEYNQIEVEKRKEIALENSWERKVDKMFQYLISQ